MGFGYKLGSDVTNERRGYIPNSGVYDRVYGPGHWKATTIISDAIGQGEILTTPLQLANLAASIANRGYYYTPHLVKGIRGGASIQSLPSVTIPPSIPPTTTPLLRVCRR